MGKKSSEQFEVAETKYRPLKKQLKKTYKSLKKAVSSGQLPSPVLVDEFMAEARVMVSYPGFGDEYYASFIAACEALEKAFRKNDAASFDSALAEIGRLKSSCHDRFK